MAEMKAEQLRDNNISPILEIKKNWDLRTKYQVIFIKTPALKAMWAKWDVLRVKNGLFKWAWESADGKIVTIQLVLPKYHVKEVLREIYILGH